MSTAARIGAGLAAARTLGHRTTAGAQWSGGQVIVRALGGAHLAAVEKAIFKPFTEATGIKWCRSRPSPRRCWPWSRLGGRSST